MGGASSSKCPAQEQCSPEQIPGTFLVKICPSFVLVHISFSSLPIKCTSFQTLLEQIRFLVKLTRVGCCLQLKVLISTLSLAIGFQWFLDNGVYQILDSKRFHLKNSPDQQWAVRWRKASIFL